LANVRLVDMDERLATGLDTAPARGMPVGLGTVVAGQFLDHAACHLQVLA
jgi:hypothetical protein